MADIPEDRQGVSADATFLAKFRTQFLTDLLSALSLAYQVPSFEGFLYPIWRIVFESCQSCIHDPRGETSIRVEQQHPFIKTLPPTSFASRKWRIPDFASIMTDDTPFAKLLFFAEIKPLNISLEYWYTDKGRDKALEIMDLALRQQVSLQNHFAKQFFSERKNGWYTFVVCGVWWSLYYYSFETIQASAYKPKQRESPPVETRGKKQQESSSGEPPLKKRPRTRRTSVPDSDHDPDDDGEFVPENVDFKEPIRIARGECLFDLNSLNGNIPKRDNCPLNPVFITKFSAIFEKHKLVDFFDEKQWRQKVAK